MRKASFRAEGKASVGFNSQHFLSAAISVTAFSAFGVFP